jgi:hypothetical protein
MPFTPFHFSPSACIALSNKKKLNILIFIFANVIIDIEPLLVIIFKLNYPLHGYAHTFLGASLIGLVYGIITYKNKIIFEKILRFLKLPYNYTLKQYILSGISGTIFHIIFDMFLYKDIQPFYPLKANPFYGIISTSLMYKFCTLLFIPTIILYIYIITRKKDNK